MNLVTEPWIPVLSASGKPERASLMQVFTQGSEYRDLAVRPHERITLMRLLICIAQAALDGPKEYDDWLEAPERLSGEAADYLERWEGSFNLFDSERPFLQVAKLSKPAKIENKNEEGGGVFVGYDSATSSEKTRKRTNIDKGDTLVLLNKMDFALATGNNTTLFDHLGSDAVKRSFEPAEVALMLLTFQSFSPGGTIGVALWDGKPTRGWKSYPKVKPGQSSHAPCLPKNMLHAFVRRDTVFNTICANLLTKETVQVHFGKSDESISEAWGKPIWEGFPNGADPKTLTSTYLGRLVPLARCIRLLENGPEMLLANGLDYPSYEQGMPAEASATVVVKRKDGQDQRWLLSASGKALWRELASLIVARKKDDAGGALTLANIPHNEAYDLWVGALLTNKASVLDTVEAVLHVPATMRTDPGRAAYSQEVLWAERIAGKLGWAVETYRQEVDGGWEGRLRGAKNKHELRGQLNATATRHFWTAVEKRRLLLIAHVEAIDTSDFVPTREEWRKAVHQAARDSYALACGQATPRQIRAFALGWSKLFASAQSNAPSEEIETVATEE